MPVARQTCSKRMLIDDEHVYYRGRLGRPTCRRLGSLTLYASRLAPLNLMIAGRGEAPTCFAVVPPYVPHSVHCSDDWITCLLIEPEYIALDRLPMFSQPGPTSTEQLPWAATVRLSQALLGAGIEDEAAGLSLDDMFYSSCALPRRQLDPRIDQLITSMRRDASAEWSALDAARHCAVSPSRFLHLFKAELGVSFRHFRIWKRARQMLIHANSTSSLTHIAQDLGYADSSYFSNSIRQVYGLRPKDIMAGSRGLSLTALERSPSAQQKRASRGP